MFGRILSASTCLGLLLVMSVCSLILADETATPAPTAKQKKAEKLAKAAKLSAERETAILEFVKTNHAELTALLEGIKEKAPAEYAAALSDLDRTVTRLEKIKDTMPARYDAQLADWKITSRIRLLTARLAISQDQDAVEAELRAAVRERFELRLATQRAELEQVHQRIEKLKASIAELSSNMDATIEKEVTQLKATKPALQARAPKKAKLPAAVETPESKESKE